MHEFFDCISGTGPSTISETTCPICLEETSPDTATITHTLCRKTFCQECLEKWVEQQPCGEIAVCPMDRQIIGVSERGTSAGDYEDDGNDDEEEEEEEGGEEPYDADGEDEAWNLHPQTPDPADAALEAAAQAEARDAEDHMWDALIFEDFSPIMETMTDDSSGILRRPSTPEGAAPRRRDTI